MQNDDRYPQDLISEDARSEMEPAVLTLAETFYEAGFGQERSLDIAWAVALLPEHIRADGGDVPW